MQKLRKITCILLNKINICDHLRLFPSYIELKIQQYGNRRDCEMSLRSSSQQPPGNMSTATGSSRDLNLLRRIGHLLGVPPGHVAAIKNTNVQVSKRK